MATTTKSVRQIVQEVEDYIANHGGSYSGWYAGVTADPRNRLFNGHNVAQNGDAYTVKDCGTDTAARSVEQHFLDRGCDGGTGGGDSSTRFFYAYKKSAHTRP